MQHTKRCKMGIVWNLDPSQFVSKVLKELKFRFAFIKRNTIQNPDCVEFRGY